MVITSHSDANKSNKKSKKNSAQEKAGSVHDLRRCAVSSLLRVPPQYTTFNETKRLPLNASEYKDQVIILQSEKVNLVTPHDSARRLQTADSSQCLENHIGQQDFVMINGTGFSRMFKLAKKWTCGMHGNHEDPNGLGSDLDLPLEELQNSADRQKRASL